MKTLFFIFFLNNILICCTFADEILKFDSAHSIAVEGDIKNGVIYTKINDDYLINIAIKNQLRYTIGQLNGEDGVADISKLELQVSQVSESEYADLYKVQYTAKLFIAWPRYREIPENYNFVLPGEYNYQEFNDFFEKYGDKEQSSSNCLENTSHDVSIGNFWYFYRPLKPSCDLDNPLLRTAPLVVTIPISLKISEKNTKGKFPEYDKVWKDGRLVVTAILGMNESYPLSEWDAGVSAYKQLYKDMLKSFGTPLSNSLPAGARPGLKHRNIDLRFMTSYGEVDIALFLVEDIKTVGTEFKQKYNSRTKISDFVSYSGHSGLGANIRALAKMGTFVEGQYQIFLVNGCDTFAYVDNSLRDAHHRANPTAGANKYFDIITNAMPSYFHLNSRSNMQVIEGLLTQQKTYRQILAGFSTTQKAVVTGEEDNEWGN